MNSSSVFNFNSRAQGTIEYLVIIAIVVVISLVVVAMMMGIFENSGDVVNTAETISTQTLPVALNEVILGVGTDANGLIVLTNNTGDLIKDIRIEIDGKDHNYFDTQISLGSSKTFRLNTLEIPCDDGETSVTKTITIIYTTRSGIEKTQKIENIKVTCATTDNPTPTKTPTEEKQNEEEPETPEPTPTDIIDPELDDLSGAVEENTITLTFRAWDNNEIQLFEIKENDGEYEEITPTYLGTDYEDGNYYSIVKEDLEYETEYTYYIRVTDYNNNTVTDSTSNITEAEPYVELCEGQTELYGTCWDNVYLYYPLDEDASDSGPNGNDGVLQNEVTFDNSGKTGNSATFDGMNSYIQSTNNISLTGTSQKTLMYWTKLDRISDFVRLVIFGERVPSSKMFGHYAETITGDLTFWSGWTDWEVGENLSIDTWYQIVSTYDGTTMKTYINGILIDSHTIAINTGLGKLEIGTFTPENDGRYFKGLMDEIIIFDTALTAEDINQLFFDSGGTPAEQLQIGLINYWPLNETTGTKAVDYAGFDNNGTISGGTTFNATSVNSNVGTAASIVGNNATITFNSQINLQTPTTLSGWYYLTGALNNWNPIWMSSGPYSFLLGPPTPYGDFSGQLVIFRSDVGVYKSTTPIANNTWNHLVFVDTGTRLVAYVNGIENPNTVGTYTNLNNYPITRATQAVNSNNFNGRLDELSIWNRALSSTEISALYNSGTGLSLIQ